MPGSRATARTADSSPSPTADARPDPGKRAPTDRLPARPPPAPASAPSLFGIDTSDDPHAPTALERITLEEVSRQLTGFRAAVRTGSLSVDAAAEKTIAQLHRATHAVEILARHHAQLRGHGHPAAIAVRDALRTAAGEPTDDPNRADSLRWLDAIAADAMDLRAQAANTGRAPQLIAAYEGLVAHAVRLEWTPPADLSSARERKYEHEACPAGDDSPRNCYLVGDGRARESGDILHYLTRIGGLFTDACKRHADALRRAIERDHKLTELLVGVAADLLVGAITGPIGASVSRGLRSAAESTDLSKFAGDTRKALIKAATKLPAIVEGRSAGGDARARTIGALDVFKAQFQRLLDEAVEGLSVLDDHELLILREKLSNLVKDPDPIEAHVAELAEHYRQQVAPIGLEDDGSENLFDGGWYRADKRAVGRAARIVMPDGDARLALVEEITDRKPAVTREARGALVAAERMLGDADDDLITGRMTRDRQDAWVETPAVELHFVRWIDDPRMQAIAGADARTVPAAQVRDLPLASLAPRAGGSVR